MELFTANKHINKNINFIKASKFFWWVSGLLIASSFISLWFKGLNYSLEFTGGAQLEIRFENLIELDKVVRNLEQAKFRSPRVQHYGSVKDFIIRLSGSQPVSSSQELQLQEQQLVNQVTTALKDPTNPINIRRVEYVGAEVGEKLLEQGAIAVIISILITMLYIAIRFEFRLAIAAAVTLCHNAIIVLGGFSIAQVEFDLATLAAILAVIGYSLNDTIVIFDRVRENLRKYHTYSISNLVDLSINQTLSRTVMTSVLTLLVVLSLLFLGGKSLFGFALALTIGIIIGTYASICIAGSVAIKIGLSRKDFITR